MSKSMSELAATTDYVTENEHGYDVHPGKYWLGVLRGSHAPTGGNVADGGSHGGGATRG